MVLRSKFYLKGGKFSSWYQVVAYVMKRKKHAHLNQMLKISPRYRRIDDGLKEMGNK